MANSSPGASSITSSRSVAPAPTSAPAISGGAFEPVGDRSTQAKAAVPNATAGACSHPLTA